MPLPNWQFRFQNVRDLVIGRLVGTGWHLMPPAPSFLAYAAWRASLPKEKLFSLSLDYLDDVDVDVVVMHIYERGFDGQRRSFSMPIDAQATCEAVEAAVVEQLLSFSAA
jgi:hypothetical protein